MEKQEELNNFLKGMNEVPKKRPLIVWVRNFNNPDSIMSIGIDKTGKEGCLVETVVTRFSLRSVIPRGEWRVLVRSKDDKGIILVGEFTHPKGIGQQIANLYQRPVTIVHMFGGGEQMEKGQKSYRFTPQV